MKRVIGISAVALLALAACSKKTETAATGDATTATATAPAAPSASMTPPSRKAGLWAQTIATGQMTQTIKMCLDAATDAKMKWWGSSQAGKSVNCSEERVTPHLGGGWDFHSVCKMGESGTITSDGSATGDFGSHYKVEVNSVTSGSPMEQANGPHKISIDAAWQGPCPAGMNGGDMELPGGMKINMSGGPLGAGGKMNSADIAKMRAQAMEMAKSMKAQQEK